MRRNKVLTKILGFHLGDRVRCLVKNKYWRYGEVKGIYPHAEVLEVEFENGQIYFFAFSDVELAFRRKKQE